MNPLPAVLIAPVVTRLSVERSLMMQQNIPANQEQRSPPLALVPTAANVEEQVERAASWWFEHARFLVTAWRREQHADDGKAASQEITYSLSCRVIWYMVYG